jgi:hypothetical protein
MIVSEPFFINPSSKIYYFPPEQKYILVGLGFVMDFPLIVE